MKNETCDDMEIETETYKYSDFSDWEHEIMVEFPDLDLLLGFVDDDKHEDFLHNLCDAIKTYKG